MNLNRRQFFKVTAAGAGASGLAVMGMMPTNAWAEVRQYKLLRASETRNNCTYCSVGCGTILYSLGDGSKNAKKSIFHIERYEEAVLSATRALLHEYDEKQRSAFDPAARAALREEANEAIAKALKARAADTLDKVLFELSCNMKNAYSRSDA